MLSGLEPAPIAPPPAPPSRSAWLIAFLAVLLAYSVPIGGNDQVTPNPNEISRLLLATSLAVDGTVAVDGAIDAYGTMEDLAVREGRSYSDKAPGLSALSVPIVWVARFWLRTQGESRFPAYWPLRNLLTWLLVALPTALLPFWMLCAYTPVAPARRPFLALLSALATPLLIYATVFFGHLPAGVLAAASYALVLRPGRSEEPPSARAAAAGGFLAALAVATDYPTVIIVAVIFGSIVQRRSGWRIVASFTAGLFAGAVPLLLYQHLAFGSPWTTGYAFKSDLRQAEVHAKGILGVTLPTFDRLWGVLGGAKRGILFYCPLLLLVPVGLAAMARRSRREAWPISIAASAYVLFAASFYSWRGGWSAAARYLIPILPLLLYPLADAVETLAAGPRMRLIVAALAAASLGHSILTLAVTPFFPVIFDAPLVQVSLQCLAEGIAAPTLLSDLTSVPALLVIGLWASLVLAAAGVALARALQAPRPALTIPAAMIAGLVLGIGIQIALYRGSTAEQERVRDYMLERLGHVDRSKELWRANPG